MTFVAEPFELSATKRNSVFRDLPDTILFLSYWRIILLPVLLHRREQGYT